MAEIIKKKHFVIEAEVTKLLGFAIAMGFDFGCKEFTLAICIPFVNVFIILK